MPDQKLNEIMLEINPTNVFRYWNLQKVEKELLLIQKGADKDVSPEHGTEKWIEEQMTKGSDWCPLISFSWADLVRKLKKRS